MASEGNGELRQIIFSPRFKEMKGVFFMSITITERASEELNKRIGERNGYLKLQTETKGLSCDSGVPTLYFVASIQETEDVLIETNDRPVLLEKTEHFFSDDLKIDYSDTVNSFQLKSPAQIINGRMTFIIKEG